MALPRELETPNWYRIDLTAFSTSLRQHDGVLLFLLIFFSLILAILFIFFYFVCKCTCGSRIRSSSRGSGQPPRAQAEAKKGGLDAESVESLPAVTYASVVVGDGEAEAERNECCICLGLFEEAEMVKVMPDCCHLFHAQCVDTWLSNRSSCPLCRASLDSVSVHIDISDA
ncbi:unnamed protein product [Cuscuta europaea]|uniref:RING-type E3 ubiquitin transferase n=1 Tax=Cuscuta europaea TaxID=41803 RepID=A0A9P1E253_CUSEU|nr:unnamed protein product [Cuscuta europaea]